MPADKYDEMARECFLSSLEGPMRLPSPVRLVASIAALVRREVEAAQQPWVDATRAALALDEDAPCLPRDVVKIALAELAEVSQGVARMRGTPTWDQVEGGASSKDGGPFVWKSEVAFLLNERAAAIRARGEKEGRKP